MQGSHLVRELTPYWKPILSFPLDLTAAPAQSQPCRSSCTAAQPLAMSFKRARAFDARIWMRATALRHFYKPLFRYR